MAVISYAGFEIERRRADLWIARRKTKTEIRQLAPAKTLKEIQASIDRFNAKLTWAELVAT